MQRILCVAGTLHDDVVGMRRGDKELHVRRLSPRALKGVANLGPDQVTKYLAFERQHPFREMHDFDVHLTPQSVSHHVGREEIEHVFF
ncbi:MAG: hypothetical protein HGA38_03570 [Candidatus Moranbacteria bacterium]|nr:hypothetical protein [Candidatus Moranbacteria bacterium]